MLNPSGNVAECTGDNVFILSGGELLTPPLSAGALRGITRGAVIGLASEMGLEVREPDLTRYDLYNADECFITGTAAEIALKLVADIPFRGRTAMALRDIESHHYHARGTETALQTVLFFKGRLHRMQRPTFGHALDGRHLGAFKLHGEDGARFARPAIDVNCAGAALAGITAYMSARQF